MNKQQKEVLQAFLDNEKAVLKKLEQNYADALAEIDDKIAILLGRQDADMQHVIYQVEYQKALKTQIQAILETLQTNEFETVSQYLTQSYEEGFVGTMYDLQSQGIPLVFPIDQEQVVQAIQAETNLSEDLYTAMGKDIADLRKKITGEISRGLSSGQMYSEISRNIASWARIPKNNAMRIARTEAHRIQTKASMTACEKAKSKGADVVKQWDASLDRKTRSSHRKVDGEIRELDEKFSNGLLYPGDPKGRAEDVINCRCALLQRARWALGNDYTKWDEDAPVVIDDDGTTQFTIVDANSYKEFKGYYKDITGQMTMNLVRSSTPKIKSQGTLEKTGKSSIIKETKLANTKRRGQLPPAMDEEKYHKIVKSLGRNGVTVVEAKGDDLRYLQLLGAEASIGGDSYIYHIGKIPSASAFYEEMIHIQQAKKYGILETTDAKELYIREILANRKLLKNQKAYGFTKEDTEDIERNLQIWESRFKKLEGVEFDESGIDRKI